MKLTQQFSPYQGNVPEGMEDIKTHFDTLSNLLNEMKRSIERQGFGSQSIVVQNILSSGGSSSGGSSSSFVTPRVGSVSLTTAGGFVSFSSPFPVGTTYLLQCWAVNSSDPTDVFSVTVLQSSLPISGFNVSDCPKSCTLFYVATPTA